MKKVFLITRSAKGLMNRTLLLSYFGQWFFCVCENNFSIIFFFAGISKNIVKILKKLMMNYTELLIG